MTPDPSQDHEASELDASEPGRLIAAIECVDGRDCPRCHAGEYRRDQQRLAQIVQVVDITRVQSGWILNGEIRDFHCEWCGMAYAVLVRYIPIELAAFPCPICGEKSELIPEI